MKTTRCLRPPLLFAFILGACAPSSNTPKSPNPRMTNTSAGRLHRAVAVEKIAIDIGAQRAGHSLVVHVLGVGRGHVSGGALENPKAWRVTATHQSAPLRLVLAGPAKVSRAPTGAAMGDQWDVEIEFMVAFALPDNAGTVSVRVQAPSGEIRTEQIDVKAPSKMTAASRTLEGSKSVRLLARL